MTLFDEALRYASDDAKSWNLYANAMSIVHRNAKAIPDARKAVALAARNARTDQHIAQRAHGQHHRQSTRPRGLPLFAGIRTHRQRRERGSAATAENGCRWVAIAKLRRVEDGCRARRIVRDLLIGSG